MSAKIPIRDPFNSRYALHLFAVIIGLPLVFVLPQHLDIATLTAVLAGAIAIYLGLIKNQSDNDRLFKELFKEFNNRYDNRLNDLFNSIRANPRKALSQTEINIVIDYFNLCGEEFLWFKKARIPSDVWQAWAAGIKSNLEIPQIREIALAEVKSVHGRKSYYGLWDAIKLEDEAEGDIAPPSTPPSPRKATK